MPMFGLMAGKILLKRSFSTAEEAETWGRENAKGESYYTVVPVRKGAAGLMRDVPDNVPPDASHLIAKWAKDAKATLPPEDISAYRQGLVDAARLCEMMGGSEGCAEAILGLSTAMVDI